MFLCHVHYSLMVYNLFKNINDQQSLFESSHIKITLSALVLIHSFVVPCARVFYVVPCLLHCFINEPRQATLCLRAFSHDKF